MMSPTKNCLLPCITVALLLGSSAAAFGQGFAALVAPPRFELKAKPGSRVREVIEITNGASQPARYRFRTADWTLAPDGRVSVADDLQPASCRPWVAIERNAAEVPAGGRLRYRFEVAPPVDAPAGECRFAVLIEGEEAAIASGDNFRMPIKGRIAVVVYVSVGEAAPRLEIDKAGTVQLNGQRVPAVFIRNTGNAHGRLSGFLTGTDGQGRRWDYTPSSLPILPGETFAVTLSASNDRGQPVETTFPITIRGTLEWAGGRLPFEHRFD
jgi:hypothetical protein